MLRKLALPLGWMVLGLLGTGCTTTGPLLQPHSDNREPLVSLASKADHTPPGPSGLPTEKDLVSFPPYVIEPPDILVVDVIRAVPKGPYLVQPMDVLWVYSTKTPMAEPINGPYPVSTDGRVNLGPSYGAVMVADQTIEKAQETIRKQLATILKEPVVTLSLAQSGGVQQIRGEHVVYSDGTIRLGTYGGVRVVGMTLDEARAAIEAHLGSKLIKPVVSLDVYSFNSKYYYVITDGGGYGEQIYRLPNTGNEKVLDALALINGLPPVASRGRIWVARPAPAGAGCRDQILPVDYCGITRGGQTATNYQILPGDRVYVMASPLVTGTTWFSRALAPVEQAFGVTLLGATAYNQISGRGLTTLP
jgi:polysaccharide export outer membrane protein